SQEIGTVLIVRPTAASMIRAADRVELDRRRPSPRPAPTLMVGTTSQPLTSRLPRAMATATACLWLCGCSLMRGANSYASTIQTQGLGAKAHWVQTSCYRVALPKSI